MTRSTEQARPPDAMPFRLTCVPHPDPNDQAAASAAQAASAQFDALAELSSTAEDGTLVSYAVATHDPETARRLKTFVEELKAEQDEDDTGGR